MNLEGFFLKDDAPNPGETIAMLREKIGPYFDILAENVKGSHISGRSLVIDLLVKPKEALIKDGFANVVVGINFRDPLMGPGATRDMPRKARELIDLAHTRFGEHGALALLVVYPGFFAHMRADQRQKLGEAAGFWDRLMAQFNIGELKPEGKNLVLMCGGARYWDSVFGINNEREYHFTPLLF